MNDKTIQYHNSSKTERSLITEISDDEKARRIEEKRKTGQLITESEEAFLVRYYIRKYNEAKLLF